MNHLNNSDIPHATQSGTTSSDVIQPPALMQQSSAGGKKPANIIAVLFGVILLLFAMSLLVAFPRSERFVVELGDDASVSPTDYLFGYSFIVNRGNIDVSQVDTGKVGDYKAAANLFFYRYTLDVSVVDTTPPEIVPFADELFIATGKEYKPKDFAQQVSDLSGAVKCRVMYGETERENIAFPVAGGYSLILEAEDQSGNVGSCEISFNADDPPVIIGVFDRHLPVGTDFDITRAAAVDTGDGNLTDSMKVDRGGFDPQTEGDYTVTYSVADSHGLLTEKSVTVSVCSRRTLSLYKGRDEISLSDDEIHLLCGAGFFTYQPLDTPDYDKTVRLIEPTLIDLKQERSNGYAAGSACIYKITPDYTYMLSVKHVMKEVNRSCSVMFFDGTVVRQDLDYVSSANQNELSMFRIPTADIPTDTLMALRQIYVDADIYSTLSEGDEVVAYATHWTGTDKDLIRRMKVKRLTASISEFGLRDSLLETTEGVVSGMSGTAVVDLKGKLVGLASAFGTATGDKHQSSAYHSKIDVLPEVEALLEEKYTDKAA
jgi:hypothetical protein